MKALISPDEQVIDYQGNVGERVAQVVPDDGTFPVGAPLFWTPCQDDCIADVWWYYQGTCQIKPVPPAPPEV